MFKSTLVICPVILTRLAQTDWLSPLNLECNLNGEADCCILRSDRKFPLYFVMVAFKALTLQCGLPLCALMADACI